MAIQRTDEVLGKAIDSDEEVIPRYDLIDGSGAVIGTNVKFQLKNPIVQAGTPVNKALLDELLAASGITSNTASALYLEQAGF